MAIHKETPNDCDMDTFLDFLVTTPLKVGLVASSVCLCDHYSNLCIPYNGLKVMDCDCMQLSKFICATPKEFLLQRKVTVNWKENSCVYKNFVINFI